MEVVQTSEYTKYTSQHFKKKTNELGFFALGISLFSLNNL